MEFAVKSFKNSIFDLKTVFSQDSRQSRIKLVRLRPALLAAAVLLAVSVAPAQDDKAKIPGLDKIISNNEHLCFTGSVKAVDEKHNILSINSVEGGDTEIFPIKHSTHVETADGFRKRLDVLSPGTRVIVYYDQHNDHRSVTRIELFDSQTKKKEPQS